MSIKNFRAGDNTIPKDRELMEELRNETRFALR